MLTVGIDATPLLGRRTGIGRYVEHLVAHLPDHVDLTATAWSLRGLAQLPHVVPARVHTAARPFPANLLQQLWMRVDVPTVAQLGLRHVKVLHGSNFILPPLGRGQRGALTVHDLAFAREPHLVDEASRRLQVLVPRGLARAEVVITPSQATADALCERWPVAADRIVVTPLGVDPAWSQPQERLPGLPTDYLVAVGTLEPRKGLDLLLDALRVLHGRGAPVPPLVIVGGEGWGPELDRRGLPPGRVVLHGWADTADLRRIVSHARALVFPSRDEGFGLPPLEAMAAGVPVLAADLPVTREVLGSHARLVAVTDPEALADGLLAVLDDTRGSALAHAATFTWQRCAQLTADALARAAA